MDANHVTKERFEYHGLCDSLDNNGRPYPSAWSVGIVQSINKTPIMSLQDALKAEAALAAAKPEVGKGE